MLPRGNGPECSYGAKQVKKVLLYNGAGTLEEAVLEATQGRNYSKESSIDSVVESFGVFKNLTAK